ncbi:MAG: hypothetical protein ACRCUP_03825 [Mycoplasmatales bacterium]
MKFMLFDLKRDKWTIFFSIILIYFLCVSVITKAELYVQDPTGLVILDKLPEVLKIIYGLNGFNLATYTGFYGLAYNYILLTYSILFFVKVANKLQACNQNEYLASKPIGRQKLFQMKVLSALSQYTIINLIVYVLVVLSALTVNEDKFIEYLSLIHFYAYIIGISLTFIGCQLITSKRATTYFSLAVFGLYFISSFANLNDTFKVVNKLNPFYFAGGLAIVNQKVNYLSLLIFLGLSFVVILYSLNKIARKKPFN